MADKRTDRGASTLELALLTPVLLFVILGVIQATMVFHARHVALAAAQAGARVAREQRSGNWQAAARHEGEQYAGKIGPGVLTRVHASAIADGDHRGVIVTGKAVQVIPFFPIPPVSERSEGPIECYRPDVGTGETCAGP
jgi:TadE-like protein